MLQWVTRLALTPPTHGAAHTVGGLAFDVPQLDTAEPLHLPPPSPAHIPPRDRATPVLSDVGRAVHRDMLGRPRPPLAVGRFHLPAAARLPSVVDMHVKAAGSDTIVVPRDLAPLAPLLQGVHAYELAANPACRHWHMWLLVDTRPVAAGACQRNPGFHYDGCALAGRFPNKPVTSIYSWCNALPTQFYVGPVEFPAAFDGTRDNASLVLQQQPKPPGTILTSRPGVVYRFDGVTPHAGQESAAPLHGRVFVRVCFTPAHIPFNRLGNTPNPCLPRPFEWVCRGDPGSTLPRYQPAFWGPPLYQACQFRNLWRVACLGHPAFGTREASECAKRGAAPVQQKLVAWLRANRGPGFVACVARGLDEARGRLLVMAYQGDV